MLNCDRRIVIFLSLVIMALLGSSACGPAPAPPPQTDLPPFVVIKRVSNATPELGETVTIKWEYRQDSHPNAGPKLKNQVVQFISLTIDGGAFIETRGCFPDGSPFLFGQPPEECISSDERSVEFKFAGPVMFRLVAFSDETFSNSDNNVDYRRAIKFTLPNMSFKATVNHIQNDSYPRIFGSSFDMEFERAFGLYEVPGTNDAEDGIVDVAAPGQELAQVFPVSIETLEGQKLSPPFFASSSKPQETENFGFQKGGNFPLLQNGFLDTPNGQFFRDVKTNANIVILGGSIRFDGTEVERVKADAGGEVSVTEAANLSVLFVQIDVRAANIDPPQFLICDVHVISPRQGLVISTFAGHNSTLSPPTLGTDQVSVDTSQQTFKSSGSIKGALAGFDVLTEGNVAITPAQSHVDVTWTNIPIFPDNDISGLKGTYIKFVKD